MTTDKVLIVDDDHSIRWMLVEALKEWGYQAVEAATCQSALFAYEAESPSVVLLDIDLPDGSGLGILREVKSRDSEAIVIMVTASIFFDNAVEALRGGAFDFINKPVNLPELQITLRNALETRRLRKKIGVLRRQQTRQFNFDQLVGESPAMKEMVALARKVAESEASAVLLQGESGTGKELVARAIHYDSPRADGPFVPINCAAIPTTLLENELFGHEKGSFTDAKMRKEGLFEQAEGGTLFLDEIGELEIGLQAKLLRVLEEGSFRRVGGVKDVAYDARIIAASNRNLQVESEARRFRADLFYRLSVIQIELPPLRARGNDVLMLVSHFIEQFNQLLKKRVTGPTPEVAEIFRLYHWPDNVRELRNVIEHMMILEDARSLTSTWLPRALAGHKSESRVTPIAKDDHAEIAPSTPCEPMPAASHYSRIADLSRLFPLPPAGVSLEAVEKSLLLQAIKQAQGNQTRAAELLHITRDQFRYRLKKLAGAHSES